MTSTYLRRPDGPPERGSAGTARELFRPYLDLGTGAAHPIHAAILAVVAQQLADPTLPTHPAQTHPPARFRDHLLASISPEHGCATPGELPPHLQTTLWAALLEATDRYGSAPAGIRARVLAVLGSLSFYPEVLRLQPDVDENRIAADPEWAVVALKVANARKKTGGDDHLPLLARTARDAPGARLRLSAACSLAVEYSRPVLQDVTRARHWADVAADEHRQTQSGEPFVAALDESIYWRAVSFVSFLEGDRPRTVRELDAAEAAADAVPPQGHIEEVAWRENRHPLLETRTKEALWLRDFELATERAERLVAHDPWDAKVRLQLSDVHLRAGRHQHCAAALERAASLGPPYAAAAWFKLGLCREAADEPRMAAEAYFRSAAEDPSAVSPLVRLARADLRGSGAYRSWAQQELQHRTAAFPVATAAAGPGGGPVSARPRSGGGAP